MVIQCFAVLLIAMAVATPAAAQTVFIVPQQRQLAPRVVTLDSLRGRGPVTLAQLEATLKANGLQWRQQSPGTYIYQHPSLPACGEFRRPQEAGKSLVQSADRSSPGRAQAGVRGASSTASAPRTSSGRFDAGLRTQRPR